MSAPIALCPTCGEPLISTFAFSGYEFLCLCCGRRVTFFGPKKGDGDNPRLVDRLAQLQAEWDAHVGPRLLPHSRFRRTDCEKCKGGEDHWAHVTEAERVADEEAREWLRARTAGDAALHGRADS
jgi:hypothetical protein